MTRHVSIVVVSIFMFAAQSSFAQQQITVDVSPSISKSIRGEKEFKREKYICLSSDARRASNVLDDKRFDYYFRDLEMSVGRQLGLVKAVTNWGNSLREDVNRPGWTDIEYFKSKQNPSDNGLDEFKAILGNRQGLAAHDGHNAYPNYMDQYTIEGTNESFPTNNDAAAELSSHVLKYAYTDFQRPSFFELVNEPHWKFWSDPRFIEHHTKANEAVDAMGIDVLVGGPCFSVSNFYKNEYGNLSHITDFIDKTEFKMDFYSFHSYDYMEWDDNTFDFVGSINSGLPLEGVIDGIAAHTYNKYSKEFKYVCSEHGGYVPDEENKVYAMNKLADMYFPGSGFAHEMEKRTICNFIMVNGAIANTMVFVNHPHIVLKSVPFILLESSGWDPEYYSSLLVKENFNPNSNVWCEARLIDFYKFFEGVKGRRVESFCWDTDIQNLAFVNGKELILLFHNQSNVEGNINVTINGISTAIDNMKIRRVGRKEDFRAQYEEKTIHSLNDISIKGQESVALFITYAANIPEKESFDEKIYYCDQTGIQFTGSKSFNLSVPDYHKVRTATLRVGLSRKADNSKEVKISLNGTDLGITVEDCAERITGDMYAPTKIVKIDPSLLQENNTVQILFPDGKSGGVGAIVIRATLKSGTPINDQSMQINPVKQLRVFPCPATGVVTINNRIPGTIEIINYSGKVIKRIKTGETVTTISLDKIPNGIYVIRFSNSRSLQTLKLSVLR